jgi:hypothetical protein
MPSLQCIELRRSTLGRFVGRPSRMRGVRTESSPDAGGCARASEFTSKLCVVQEATTCFVWSGKFVSVTSKALKVTCMDRF